MHMDRDIFNLNASVPATSLYILLCALLDQGEVPTLNKARATWNGTDEELRKAAEELIEREVLSATPPLSDDTPLNLTPKSRWH